MMMGIKAQQMTGGSGPTPPLPDLPYPEDITHWFRSSYGAFKDPAGTTPATIGDTVGFLLNNAVNGLENAVQNAPSQRLDYAEGYNGIPALQSFSQGRYFEDLNISAPPGPTSIPENRIWVYVFDVSDTPLSRNPISGATASESQPSKLSGYYRNPEGNFRMGRNDFVRTSPKRAILVCCTYRNNSMGFVVNGSFQDIFSVENYTFDGTSTANFLRDGSLGTTFEGLFYEMITWGSDRTMTEAELVSVSDKLNQYYNFY